MAADYKEWNRTRSLCNGKGSILHEILGLCCSPLCQARRCGTVHKKIFPKTGIYQAL